MAFEGLNLARSRWVGGISELAVLSPIIPGRVPGERRTYEERLRTVLGSLADRTEAGLLTPLHQITTLHFGHVLIIQPEHYLTHSKLKLEDAYYPDTVSRNNRGVNPADPPARQIPLPLDQYVPFDPSAPPPTVNIPDPKPPPDNSGQSDPPPEPEKPAAQNPYEFRSWLMTHVIFDGDPLVYLREIATIIENDFDQVFENCEDYPYARNFEKFWAWVRRYQIRADAFYTPYPNLSIARMKQLEAFKNRFDAFVAKVRTPAGHKVDHMDELFDAFLLENQQFASGFPSPGGAFKTSGNAD